MARASSSAATGWLSVLTKSWRRSATTQPSALVMPGRAGTSTLGRPSSRASAEACSGPAPPKANSAKSRGSWPRDTDTMRIAPAIFMLPSLQHRGRRVDAVEAGGPADPVREDLPDVVERDTAASTDSSLRRRQPPEHQIGVGDGRLRAAAAVADRAGIGAGAFRPDLDQAGRVDAGDRAAAGADRVHVDHRHVDRHRIFDLDLVGDGRLGVADQRDVGRGAAHVVGDEVVGNRRACRYRRRR